MDSAIVISTALGAVIGAIAALRESGRGEGIEEGPVGPAPAIHV